MSIETETTLGEPEENGPEGVAETEEISDGAATPPVEVEEVEIGFAPEPGEKPGEDEESFEGKPAPEWVKTLRKTAREQARRIKELEGQVHKANAPVPVEDEPKPTLEGCDYDPELFERQLLDWKEKQRVVEERKQKEVEKQKESEKAWGEKLENYAKRKSEIKAADYDDAESEVVSNLNQAQQGIIVQYAENPAALVYALGKHPGKLKELSAIDDPILFAFRVKELEGKVQTKTSKIPSPDTPLRPTGGSGVKLSTLDELREEAERTGDYTKVIAYKAKTRDKK
jgi:hypothetical protein